MWHEHDQWKMTPLSLSLSLSVSSLGKRIRRTELSVLLSSVSFGCWLKIISCRLRGSYFVVELKFISVPDHY